MVTFDTKNLEGLEVLVLRGEIDMYQAPKIREALLAACDRCSRGVAVDLSEVSYMDSSGIATLIEGLQWAKRCEGRFMLIGVQTSVMGTLRLAKLHEIFELFPTQEAALASLA